VTAVDDLTKDIGEEKNIAAEMPEKVEQMMQQLAEWEKGTIPQLWSESAKWNIRHQEAYETKFKTGEIPNKPGKKK
jgi:hypothetical protein